MRHELLLAMIILSVATLPFMAGQRSGRLLFRGLMIGFVGFWMLVPMVAVRTASEQTLSANVPAGPQNRPVEEHSLGYVGSDSCRSCHPRQHASWHSS